MCTSEGEPTELNRSADQAPHVKLSECDDVELLRSLVGHLYALLDDIDTADDIAKGNDKLYRSIVYRAQSRKNEKGVCSLDGYAIHAVRLVSVEKVEKLREMKDAQCANGNWDYDPYMHGLANGMLFSLSIFDNNEPRYLAAPEIWGKDKPVLEKPESHSKTSL